MLDPLPTFEDVVAVGPLPGGGRDAAGRGGTPFTRTGDVVGPTIAIAAVTLLLAAIVLGRARAR